MKRKILACVVALLFAQAHAGAVAVAAATKPQTVEQVRARIDRAGLGEKARVTVWRRDGTKLKGYVAERRDADFVLRDRKTDAPSIVPYADVTKVDINRGHSTARNVTLGVVIGATTFLTLVFLTIAANDD